MMFLPFFEDEETEAQRGKVACLKATVSETSCQKFELQAVSEIFVTLQEAFSLETHGMYREQNKPR